ncbi:MAG TPA: hypothetical protein VIS09_10415 [Streptomyces sp.]
MEPETIELGATVLPVLLGKAAAAVLCAVVVIHLLRRRTRG